MKLILILSCVFNIQGKESYMYDSVIESFNVGLYSDIYRSVSFRLGMVIETTKVYVLISVWMIFTFIQGNSCIKKKKKKTLVSIFSQIWVLVWMKFSMLRQPVLFLRPLLNLLCINKQRNIQPRELSWCCFLKYTFNIVMCQDTSEPICFKLGIMLNAVKLCNGIPVWMTLLFTQGHRGKGKLELVQSFCWKLHEATQMCMRVDYVREITDYEYGPFEHLLVCVCVCVCVCMCVYENVYECVCVCVWMTLMFTQGHRGVGKIALVQSFCWKLHEATQMFMKVDYIMRDDWRSSWFWIWVIEHLLVCVYVYVCVCVCVCVWMTLMSTQGHRVMEKLALVQSFCYTIAWSNWNVHDG